MNSSRILRTLRLNERFLRSWKTPILRRTFLSDAYQCQETWNKRLESSLLQNINPVNFFLELDQKFQTQSRVSAVDIDIFANIITDTSHIEELADVLYKLRVTRETTFTLDSTHHAVIRYYLEVGEAKQVLEILDDRLNYGIFSDYFCYNLLMDHFIKKQDFGSAARAATFMMLQEEFEHPISNALAIYSCHKYLENPDTWVGVDPATLIEEPKEEVKVRVRYIRNPYFDDHFDLWKSSDLVGKTLYSIGRTMDDALGRSCQLRGLILYRKYADAIELLKKWKQEGTKEVVYKDIPSLIKKDVPELFGEEDKENAKELRQLLSNLESTDLYQGNLYEDMENLIKKSVDSCSQEDISKQTKLYSEWEEKRIQILREHLAELDKQARLAKLLEMKQELVERERVLTFFENEEKIELTIQQKLDREKALYGDERQAVHQSDEDYVPPEIVKRSKQ